MPGCNRTGPAGQGQRTGRGRGSCNTSIDTLSFPGTQGAGFGRGMGRRRGNQFARNQDSVFAQYPEDNVQEIDMLKTEANAIKQTLEQINSQIKNLEKTTKET